MSGIRKTGSTTAPGAAFGLARGREYLEAADRGGRGDSNGITPAARELARALHAVDAVDEVRAARVAALRAQIANGTYNPDPREVAKRLLERGSL